MYKSNTFAFLEWMIMFILVPIPVVNLIFIVFLIHRYGLIFVLKKLLILLIIYTIAALIALMFTNLL